MFKLDFERNENKELRLCSSSKIFFGDLFEKALNQEEINYMVKTIKDCVEKAAENRMRFI